MVLFRSFDLYLEDLPSHMGMAGVGEDGGGKMETTVLEQQLKKDVKK